MRAKDFIPSLFGVTILIMLVYAGLAWLKIPAGSLIDWLVGIACFWWLLVIVTAPWNMHFRAKEILADIATSQEKDINVRQNDIEYAQAIAKRYLMVAIALHIFSAVVMYLVAFFEVSMIGYWASIAALLLTLLRPVIRLHDYVLHRLQLINQDIKYPREDVSDLKNKVYEMEIIMKNLEKQLDTEKPDSTVSQLQRTISENKQQTNSLRKELNGLINKNDLEHQKLAQQQEDAISKFSEDAKFLNQVRDLVRFIKNA